MIRYVYPARLSHDKDGRVLVKFPDFSFGATDGADVTEALVRAVDCLEELIAGHIADGLPVPAPSSLAAPAGEWGVSVAPGPVIAAKAALADAVREKGITKVALGRALGITEKDARRMLDPRFATKIPALDRALATLGKRLEVTVRDMPREIDDFSTLAADAKVDLRAHARAHPMTPRRKRA